MNMTKFKTALTVAALLVSPSAMAVPFTLTLTLTGDSRTTNPDNIFVSVTVTDDDTTNFANFTVDLNSPLHPDAKLGAFPFNVIGTGTFTATNFLPGGSCAWDFGDGSNAAGSGSADFCFEVDDDGAGNNATNSTNLTFRLIRNSGLLSASSFLIAGVS
jgi:hypothetical protein